MPTAAIYVRISNDPDGKAAGVERQKTECKVLAITKGLDVTKVYEDNDKSAYSDKRRPAYDELLDDAERGLFDVLIVWASDRLYRKVEDLVEITRRLEGIPILVVMESAVDLTTAEGRLRAQMLGAFGEFESARKGERIRSKWDQRANEGRSLSSRKPFGWRWRFPCPAGDECRHEPRCEIAGVRPEVGTNGAGLVPDPHEGPLVAECYRQVATGATLESVRRWLKDQPHGKRMDPTPLRLLLQNPRNAGLVRHRGEIRGDIQGVEPLIDRETYETVVRLLSDPSRKKAPGRPTTTLLGGMLRCETCGKAMTATAKGDVLMYGCHTPDGHTYRRKRQLLDNPILDLVGEVIASLEDAGMLAMGATDTTDPIAEQIAVLEGRLAAADAAYQSGDLDPIDFSRVARGLRTSITTLQSQQTRVTARKVTVTGVDAWKRLVFRWQLDDHDVADLRLVLAEFVDHIVVLPAKLPRRPRVSDVRIEWADWIPARNLLPSAPRAA